MVPGTTSCICPHKLTPPLIGYDHHEVSPSSSRRSATGNCKQLAVGPPLGSRRRATNRNPVVPAASNTKEQNEKESHRHAGVAIGGLLRPFFQNFEWHGPAHCCAR